MSTERPGRREQSGGQPQQEDGSLRGDEYGGEPGHALLHGERRKQAVCVQDGWEPGRHGEFSRG